MFDQVITKVRNYSTFETEACQKNKMRPENLSARSWYIASVSSSSKTSFERFLLFHSNRIQH